MLLEHLQLSYTQIQCMHMESMWHDVDEHHDDEAPLAIVHKKMHTTHGNLLSLEVELERV